MVFFDELDLPTVGQVSRATGVDLLNQDALSVGIGFANGGGWATFGVECADVDDLLVRVDALVKLEGNLFLLLALFLFSLGIS